MKSWFWPLWAASWSIFFLKYYSSERNGKQRVHTQKEKGRGADEEVLFKDIPGTEAG
jgi:hypothetical protein